MTNIDIDKHISGIYQIVNTLNSKVYTGSAVCIKDRIRKHIEALNKNKHHSIHLQRAWNKYGSQAFEVDIVQKCAKSNLLFYEQKWIDLTNSSNKKFGYNIDSVAGSRLGSKHSKETKIKISEASYFPVLQYNFDGNLVKEWKSQKEAADYMKCKTYNICNAIKGFNLSAKGFIWKRKTDNNFPSKIDPYTNNVHRTRSRTKASINKQVETRKNKVYPYYKEGKTRKKVNLIYKDKTIQFESVQKLQEYLNVANDTIYRCINKLPSKKLKDYKIEYT